ncbi:MAG: DUF2334 domain-containing protein [Nanoarchaeota archaeon]|nr:DUF2334 domain-containing protein [Nanoarchaeota archaeon]MBU4116603.1 DUF2334 domain-containing protein [Nanoarchaeota archaeon]
MKKQIFFRNDDVWKLDKNLKNLVKIFLSNKIPLHLSVIPGKMTIKCKDFLKQLIKKYPELIEIGQHGFMHKNYSNKKDKFSKYEFGEKRTYEEQKKDILEGKKILNSITRIDIFTPPWHGFDNQTLKILMETKYSIISTDLKKPVLNNSFNLKRILTSIYLNKRNDSGWYFEQPSCMIEKIIDANYENIGIQIHHKAFNNVEEFNQLGDLLKKLKQNNTFKFIKLSEASENSLAEKELDLDSLIYYLTYQFVPKPLTLIKNLSNRQVEKYDFQDINEKGLLGSEESESVISKKLYFKLHESIKQDLPKNDEAIGVLLSGGMDSAIILYLLRKLTSRKIYTMTGAYACDTPNLKFARQLSEKYNTIHEELIINPKQMLELNELYSKKIFQPIGDTGFLPTYLMMEKLKQKTKIIFSGDGADCLFMGLKSHHLNYIDKNYPELAEMDNELLKNKGAGGFKSDNKNYPDFEHYKYGEIFMTKKEIKDIFNKDIDLIAPLNQVKNQISKGDFIKNQILLDLNFFVKNRVDYVLESARVNGVDIKLPYLNKDFIKFILKIPSKYIFKNLKQKYILKKSFEDKLPREISNQEKQGFSPPFSSWYEQNLPWVMQKLNKSRDFGISQNYINNLIKQIKDAKDYKNAMKIWLILNLVVWFENY